MKSHLPIEKFYTAFKKALFNDDEPAKEHLQELFTQAKLLNDIDTIKVLAEKHFLNDAVLYLSNQNVDLNSPDLVSLIVIDVSFDAIKDAIDNGAYIHKRASNGTTALIAACAFNHTDIVKLLLQNGANANDRHINGPKLVETIFKLGHKEVLELLIEYGADDILKEYAVNFFYKVNEKLPSQFVAEQFVYEELDAAAKGNDESKQFVNKSGVKDVLYHNAMKRSLPEVDGENGPQQLLLSKCLNLLNETNNKDLIAKIRLITIEMIMSKWRIGKYEKKINKLLLDNNSVIYIHSDHALIDNEVFKHVENDKYWHQTRRIYLELEIWNNSICFYQPVYDGEKEVREFFGVISQEDILRPDIKHNPKRLVEILSYFTKDNPIKYTAHSFDWNRYGTYNDFMQEVKNTFESINEDLTLLSPNLQKKMYGFLFSDKLGRDNTWGMNQIDFGWSSPELVEWAKLEESKQVGKKAIYFPLPKKYCKEINHKTLATFDDVCNVFKNEIEMRDDDKLISLFELLEEEVLGFDDEFEVEYFNLEGISFYTDVERFKKGLTLIYELFKEGSRKKFKNIKVKATTGLDYVDVKIIQVNSSISKTKEIMEKEVESGDFQSIKKYFTSLCDWSIEAKNKNESFSVSYLSTDSENLGVYSLGLEPEGFTHILRFYK